jgi:hypothetical protein
MTFAFEAAALGRSDGFKTAPATICMTCTIYEWRRDEEIRVSPDSGIAAIPALAISGWLWPCLNTLDIYDGAFVMLMTTYKRCAEQQDSSTHGGLSNEKNDSVEWEKRRKISSRAEFL